MEGYGCLSFGLTSTGQEVTLNSEKKPARGIMPRSQLARRQEYLEATSGSVTISPRIAQRIAVSLGTAKENTISMEDARRLAVAAVARRATQKKAKK